MSEKDFHAGWEAARQAALVERNRLARACADANEERDEARRELAKARDLLSIRDDDFESLLNEFERVTGRDWIEELAARWSS